jgi:hypothetical protein
MERVLFGYLLKYGAIQYIHANPGIISTPGLADKQLSVMDSLQLNHKLIYDM